MADYSKLQQFAWLELLASESDEDRALREAEEDHELARSLGYANVEQMDEYLRDHCSDILARLEMEDD